MEITVTYNSIDGYRKAGHFKTIAGAARFASKWVGKHPDIGNTYAVSADGVGTIHVRGITLEALFATDDGTQAGAEYVELCGCGIRGGLSHVRTASCPVWRE